jgi:hypothetical protein
MSITENLFYSPLLGKTTSTSFFENKYVVFEGMEKISSDSKIRLLSSFLFPIKPFNNKEVVTVKDIKGEIFYLDRDNLSDWLLAHHEGEIKRARATKKDLYNVTDGQMGRWLCEVLLGKTPQYIVEISEIKNKLKNLEEQKKLGDQMGWNSIAHIELPVEIEKLKKRLAELEAEGGC